MSESRGLYGSLFKVHTTYTISENYLKREQKLGGINSVFDNYAGIIVDLKKDSVVLYYSNNLSGRKHKHTTSIQNFKKNPTYQSFPNSLPSPIDKTFNLLPDYQLIKQIADSMEIKGFNCDYTLFKDKSGIFKQEVFDTKEIKVKREILEMVFKDIPTEINFLLTSDLRTTITDISNDSIVSGQQSKAIDVFLRDVFQKEGATQNAKKTDLEKLAKNKWVKLGLKALKKGVDLNIHITTEVSALSKRSPNHAEFSFPSTDFEEISDIDVFLESLPQEGEIEFDD